MKVLSHDSHGDVVEVELAAPKRCDQPTPRWFEAHWREWHRGHGCDKDDGQPPTLSKEEHPRALVVEDRSDADLSALPQGERCGTCRNFGRCSWLIGASEDATNCDWSPSRFRRREV